MVLWCFFSPRLVADIEPDLIPRTGETRNEIQQRVDSSRNGESVERANSRYSCSVFHDDFPIRSVDVA